MASTDEMIHKQFAKLDREIRAADMEFGTTDQKWVESHRADRDEVDDGADSPMG